ncbi:MAG: prepilin-type N-terminal cleavage/methylation domain-containing protein [Planctomycetes bacterium]|nr:prepilin-type N-terminal cleavage/methylation domain-containing protein [Planctomycetota bacterium]
MTPDPARRTAAGGFTLLELLVTMTMVALLFAIVVPNLGAFVPSARLRGSGKQILRTLDWARSEARIQARPMTIEFDLDHARWRIVHPPELRLTRDEDENELMEWSFDWNALEDGVVFAGAGDSKHGMAKKGVYKLAFDEHGFTGDQLVLLQLTEDPKVVWGLSLRGLTGQVTVEESDQGQTPELQYVEEGAF